MVVLPLVLLVGLAAGIGYFRLLQGPVTISFLLDPIQRGIDRGLPGLSAAFDDVILTLGGTGGLELRLKNLRLSEETGDVVISAPQAAIQLHAGSLWGFEASPERVELIEPRISLVYSRHSGVTLNISAEEALPAAGQGETRTEGVTLSSRGNEDIDLAGVMTSAVNYARESGGAASTLRELGLRNATLLLDAEGRTSLWQVPRLLIDVEHRADRTVISGSARVSSAGRIWAASFRAEEPSDGNGFSVLTSIRDVVPEQIAEALPGADLLEMFDAPTSADIKADFDRDGQIVRTEVALEVAGSRLQPEGMDGPVVSIDAGVLNFVYEPAARRLALLPSTVRSEKTSVTLSGEATSEAGASSGQEAWSFEVRAAPGVLGDPASGSGAIALESGIVRGRFVASGPSVTIETAKFDLAGGSIELSGDIDVGSRPSAKFNGGFEGMPVSQLAALWPRAVASGGRTWFRNSVRDGQVAAGTITYVSGRHLSPAAIPEQARTSRLVIAMEVENVVFDVVEGLPPLSAERILARFENDVLEVTLPAAVMDVGGGDTIDVRAGRFVGLDMLGTAPSGQMNLNFEGPASGMQRLFEAPVLADAARGPTCRRA